MASTQVVAVAGLLLLPLRSSLKPQKIACSDICPNLTFYHLNLMLHSNLHKKKFKKLITSICLNCLFSYPAIKTASFLYQSVSVSLPTPTFPAPFTVHIEYTILWNVIYVTLNCPYIPPITMTCCHCPGINSSLVFSVYICTSPNGTQEQKLAEKVFSL